jgi:serine/threonine protein kinase/Tol biopolymer transport system component
MALPSGTRLGPYEILALLGAGGMGEVYRARDGRLERDVAIKVLPASFAAQPDRLRRFEQEARVTSGLNHPNILTIYDFGVHKGCVYIVSELLQGQTVRGRLRGGALPPRKAIEYALQTARGLAAAHEKRVVHRDLKPENIFLTNDGRVKILDFGLAKLTDPAPTDDSESGDTTVVARTEPGTVLGTVGYMSPEQIRSLVVDHRSDIFALGAILYEMLTGNRAFRGDSPADTMSAILNEEPAEAPASKDNIPPALDRVVRHCLEKKAAERFQSASDLAFSLESLLALSRPTAEAPVAASDVSQSRRRFLRLAAGTVPLLAVGAGYFLGKRARYNSPPSFRQLTFRQGTIWSARFAPDGQTVVYSAAWEGKPVEVFSTRTEGGGSRSLGLSQASILAISTLDAMALLVRAHTSGEFRIVGTLAEAPLGGGAPREILPDVEAADWSPDGSSLAVVRAGEGNSRLEWPQGRSVSQAEWISHPRISPEGEQVAFIEHSSAGDDAGWVALVDRQGKKRILTSRWSSVLGLAWSPLTSEIWFTGASSGNARALYAVSLAGRQRLVARVAEALTLLDLSRDGRALMAHDHVRVGIFGLVGGGTQERNLSWLDYSIARDISVDGKTLLFIEGGAGAGATDVTYLGSTEGSSPVRLGEASGMALSPDGKWVLALRTSSTRPQLVLLPAGAGEPRQLDLGTLSPDWANWFPDGQGIVFSGSAPGRGSRLYVERIDSSATPRPISGEGVSLSGVRDAVSPDARFVAALGPDQVVALYPVESGDPHPIPGVAMGDLPVRWTADGNKLYLFRREDASARVYLLDIRNGRRVLWKQLAPTDPAGIREILSVVIAPDLKSYLYSYNRTLGELYLVEGLK